MSAVLQKDNCWFSHDANAKDDYKSMLLIDQMGLEGYGIFWVLVETLREQKDYKYPLQLVPSLARKYNTTQAKMETVINAYGLFEVDEQSFFFSGSLNRRMAIYEQQKQLKVLAGKKGGKKSAANRAQNQKQQFLELSESNSTQAVLEQGLSDAQPIKEKESKEKKSKEKETLSSREDERDIFKNLQSFKNHFIKINTNQPFFTKGIGYEASTKFKVDENGYIINLLNNKLLSKDEAYKVWECLFVFYKNQKIGA